MCCDSLCGNQTVVVEEVDSFLFRPHVGSRARYYAVSTPFRVKLACVKFMYLETTFVNLLSINININIKVGMH